jgi:hypothetical protein
MKTFIKRAIWFSGALILALALILEWPFLRQEASATEVNIDTSSFATGTESNAGAGPRNVFVSDQVGYVFYVDSTGDCVYSKTTDGGANWGSAVTFDNQTGDDCLMPTIWYDRWTPGDTTGNYIHIVTKDPGDDGLWYNRLDSSDDSLLVNSSVDVSISTTTHTMGTNNNTNTYPAITKATDGDLYIGIQDDVTSGAYVIKCTGSCDNPSNWALTETYWTTGIAQTFPMVLMPLAGGDIMAIQHQVSGNDIEYQTYDEGTDDWSNESSAWVDVTDGGSNTANAEEERFSPNIAATVDPLTNDIYISYVDTETNGASGGGNDDIDVWRFGGSSWTMLASAVSNYDPDIGGANDEGIVLSRIGFNTNNTDLYVVYTAETTAGTTTSANIYYKTCNYTTTACDAGGDWSAESSALNSSGTDNYDALSINISSRDRMYVIWNDESDDDLRGEIAADIGMSYSLSAYRLFANANSTDVGSALAVQDTSATLASAGDAFRLRLLLHITGDGARTNLDALKLQFAAKSGTCDTSYTGESYADVTTGTAISYNDNATPTDGSNLTGNANDPSHSTDDTVDQTYEELNNFTNSTAVIPSGDDGLWDFALYDNGAASSTSYCFRVLLSDGTAIAAPSVVPEIITAGTADPCTSTTVDQQMRHGNVFDGGVEQKFCW